MTEYDEEYQKDNNIKIADKDIRIYNGEILQALVKHDEVELSTRDSYVEKMLIICQMWESVGVRISSQHKNNGRIKIFKEVIPGVKNKRSGRIENITVNKICLIKDPELFRFTYPDKNVEDISKIKRELE